MKLFDRWIEKQFAKRFPEKYWTAGVPDLKVTIQENHPLKYRTCLTLEKSYDIMLSAQEKLEMMAHRFIPHIADNMQIWRSEDFRMNTVMYEAQIQIIPVEKGIVREEEQS